MTNKFRDRAALMAMQGMLASGRLALSKADDEKHYREIVNSAINFGEIAAAEHAKRYGVASSTDDTKELVSSKTQNTVHNEWIEWNGGECPVDGDTVVEVKLRGGRVSQDLAKELNWRHSSGLYGIIRYRVVSPPAPQGDE